MEGDPLKFIPQTAEKDSPSKHAAGLEALEDLGKAGGAVRRVAGGLHTPGEGSEESVRIHTHEV